MDFHTAIVAALSAMRNKVETAGESAFSGRILSQIARICSLVSPYYAHPGIPIHIVKRHESLI